MDKYYDVIDSQMTIFDFLEQEDKPTNAQEYRLSETHQDK